MNFITDNNNEYNEQFIQSFIAKFNKEREKLLYTLEISECEKITLLLYDNKKQFIDSIKKFYENELAIPAYCKGIIQKKTIYFYINKEVEIGTFRYEIELRRIMHEFIHILYNEYVLQGKKRFVWIDEGIALNLSKERGKFVKEKYSNELNNISDINLNMLNHEDNTFASKNSINRYDVSYLAVRYLLENLSIEKFNELIRDENKIKNMGENIFQKVKEYYLK